MNDELKHLAQHAANHMAREALKGAGCMVALLAMITGVGAFSAIVVLLFA